jgi:hypothetical protein
LETVIAGFGPRGELPSPSPSLSSPPLPFLLPCAPPASPSRAPSGGSTSCAAPARPGSTLSRPASRPSTPVAPRTWPLRARARRRLGPVPVAPPAPAAPVAPRPRARRPGAPRARVPARPTRLAPHRISRPLRLASRQPCALSVLSRAPTWPRVPTTCAHRVHARATIVVRRSTFSFIPFLILV